MKQQEVLLFYLNNIAKREITKRSTSEILDFAAQESDFLWGRTFDKMYLSSNNLETKDLKILRSILKDTEIKNIYLPGQDKIIDLILEAFSLEEQYRPILTLIINMIRYVKLRRLVGEVSGSRRPVLNKNYIEYISKFCGVRESEVNKAFDPKSPLVKRGIIIIDLDGDLDLSITVQKVLSAVNIKNANDVKKYMLRESKKTKLTEKDFSYIKDEFSYIGKIVSSAAKNKVPGINILIYGEIGTGKTEFSKVLAKSFGLNLYEMGGIPGKQRKEASLQNLCVAQSLLMNDRNSLLLMDEAEDALEKSGPFDSSSSKLSINRTLELNAVPVIWIVNSVSDIDKSYLRRFTYCLEFQKPEIEQRKKIWKRVCDKYSVDIPKKEIIELADKYDVAPSIINAAVLNKSLSGQEDAISRTIKSLSTIISGDAKTDKKSKELRDFNPQILNTDTDLILLAEKLSHGVEKNFSLCLYGVAGTGKSLYARYLADKLGMKVIQKRASDLSSKYIGETEKNIANAFREAKSENAILVFDEADSFLGSRDNTTKHYEISSVNEMLTHMESAEIPFICTTNLMTNIDKAALRRFTFKVKYDYLTVEQIKTAYQHFFASDIPNNIAETLQYLTPGDFSVVRKKSKILGVTDNDEIIKMLKDEILAKGKIVKNKIGF